MHMMNTLREKIRERITERGLNYKSASLQAGVGETYVRDFIKSRSESPQTEKLKKVTDFLGITGSADIVPWESAGSDARPEGSTDRVLLVIVRETPGPIDPVRLIDIVTRLKRLSSNRCDLAFNSQDGGLAGIVVTTSMPAAAVTASVREGQPNLVDKAFVLAVSLDEDFAGEGNSSGWRHIQRHLQRS